MKISSDFDRNRFGILGLQRGARTKQRMILLTSARRRVNLINELRDRRVVGQQEAFIVKLASIPTSGFVPNSWRPYPHQTNLLATRSIT
jgi:hypothetical protein